MGSAHVVRKKEGGTIAIYWGNYFLLQGFFCFFVVVRRSNKMAVLSQKRS
jgi:hypothetical protein